MAHLPGATPTEHGPWQPISPVQTGTLLCCLRAPWWIAGGWALDLFAGRQTRNHADIDVEVLRRDQMEVRRCLAGWDLHTAANGVLRPWPPGKLLDDEVHSVWCRSAPDAPWAMQVMFAEARGGDWVYRCLSTITRPLGEVGLLTPDELPYLAPEFQLLYKAKSTRPKDDADFSMVLPLLSPAQSRWLARALTASHPDHLWLSRLSAAV